MVTDRIETYSLSRRKEAALSRQVQNSITNGWVVPSSSQYGAPVLLVPKQDKTLKTCMDYRPRNSIARKEHYPMSDRQDLIDQ